MKSLLNFTSAELKLSLFPLDRLHGLRGVCVQRQSVLVRIWIV